MKARVALGLFFHMVACLAITTPFVFAADHYADALTAFVVHHTVLAYMALVCGSFGMVLVFLVVSSLGAWCDDWAVDILRKFR